MNAEVLSEPSPTIADAESWLALGTGALLLLVGTSRRSLAGACLAASSAPLLYRGITGRWPHVLNGSDQPDSTRRALAGDRGVHVRESVRLEMPLADVYRFWRRLENLPRFMTHLQRVTETVDGKSHWVAAGPAGLAVQWDAEIINEVENELIGWQSLPGSEVACAGSVRFESADDGATMVHIVFRYDPPGGKLGAAVASVLGADPSKTVADDMARFKRQVESGKVPTKDEVEIASEQSFPASDPPAWAGR